MKRIRRLAIYLFSFGLGRGVLFISPILLANLLPSRAYGMVEWAHAAASLGATLAVLGVSSALPLIVLKKTQKGTMTGILAHNILVVLACIVFMCGALWLDDGEVLSMTASLMVAAIALQTLWSVYLKTHDKGEASLLLDAGLLALMALAAAIANYLQAADPLLWLLWVVGGYTFCLFSITVIAFFKGLQNGEAIAYQAILTIGFPLMIATVVAIIVIAFGRLVIGYLGGVLLTADYAILYRVAILPMVVHQVVLVAKFRHVYTLPDKEMERVVVFIVSMVTLSVIVFGLLFPIFGWIFGPVFVGTFEVYPLPALWILAQSILWSAISLNDMVNTRQQTMGKILPWCIGFLVISIPAAVILIQYIGVSLEHFVYVHGLLMLLFYIIQIQAMYMAGIRLMRPWALAVGSYVTLITLASLLHY